MLRAEHVKTAPSHVASSRRFCVEAQSAYSPSDVVTGVIIVDHGSRRKESNELVVRARVLLKVLVVPQQLRARHRRLTWPSCSKDARGMESSRGRIWSWCVPLTF